MAGLPPVPLMDLREFPQTFQDWLRQLRTLVATGVGSIIPWANVDKSGSNITDIVTRNHDSLQNISGGTAGNYVHLKRALTGTKTHDFGSVGAASNATTTLSVTGVAAGDKVVVSPTATLVAPLIVYGYVGSGDTVTLVCVNASAGAVAAGSKTYNVIVLEN